MKELFYLLTIFAVSYEFRVLFNPRKTLSFSREIKNFVKINKELENDGLKKKEFTKTQISWVLLNLFYIIWITIGLMTFNWIIFSIILLLSFIPKKYYIQYIIDSIITITLLLFAFINTFHLKIDLYSYLLNL